jgi:NitT/TauT family transport system substrate-binding protein
MKKHTRNLSAWAVVGAAAVLFAATPLPASAETKLVLGMPVMPPNIVHMPVFAAADLGYFKDEGLDVEILGFEGGVKAFRAAVSGDVDIASGSGPFSLVGRSKGADTRIFLAPMPKLEAVMVAQGDIKTIADLKGRKIGIQQPGGFAWVLSMTVLRSGGLKPDDVEFISILTEDVPPLVAGQIDTAILHVEQEMIAKSKKPSLNAVARLWEVEPKQLYAGFVAKESTIAGKREAMLGFTRAVIRATRDLYADQDRMVPIIMKHTGLDEATTKKAYAILVESCIWDANHGISEERVAYTGNRMEKVGNIEKGKVPSYADAVDLSLAEQALKELGMWKGPVCAESS